MKIVFLSNEGVEKERPNVISVEAGIACLFRYKKSLMKNAFCYVDEEYIDYLKRTEIDR